MMQVSLPEELLLLALHDEKGSVIPAAAAPLNGALMGAVLMELALADRLRENRNGALIANRTPTGNEILDDALDRIADADHPRMASYWVGRLAGRMRRLKDRLLDQLVARGVLELHVRRILWIFPSRSYPLVDTATERQIRDRIRAVVIGGQLPDRRTAALLGLIRACNLTDELFAPHERPGAHGRIADLTSERAATGGVLGAGLEAVLIASLMGATILYSHHAMQSSGSIDSSGYVSDWDFDDDSTWDTNWSEPSSESDSGGWSDSGSGDSGGDSGGGDGGGGDGGGD